MVLVGSTWSLYQHIKLLKHMRQHLELVKKHYKIKFLKTVSILGATPILFLDK